MNLNLAARTFVATLVAAIGGAATLMTYQQGLQFGAAPEPTIVKLERVVISGKRMASTAPEPQLASTVAAPAIAQTGCVSC